MSGSGTRGIESQKKKKRKGKGEGGRDPGTQGLTPRLELKRARGCRSTNRKVVSMGL